ncbi:amino acid permease [Rubrivirga sp.]|uniref:amino acid permease n=1 Tax=Rubrivirga sp. TaxID=1885344 RepID=UPI003B52AE53
MSEQGGLLRQLGFWDALTIGVGTMIGAGIFLLSGVALAATGPAAIFAYLAAGLVCVITAASTAELATGMPTSGGDYYFVSRALGPAFGAISGIGIWLSLTFAIAFYLFGLGEYLAMVSPVTPFWGAFGGGVLLIALNIVGAKESGRLQVVIVLVLFVILGGFSGLAAFDIEAENFTPFFPFGTAPIASTTALVFVSFLGFVKIAAVAEEIKDPARNLPRTLIGSVVVVTALYILIVLVIAGLFPQSTIGEVRDPLTAAARSLMGPFGAGVIIFAGLLATLSSANASIFAASRINLAMARDRMVPNWLAAIHPRRLTPYRAILVTGVLTLGLLMIESLETLAKTASVLQLYSYAALNVGCAFLRAARPEWYRPSYRVPGAPWLQVFAALACLGIIGYSGAFAQAALVGLILFSLGWYAVWGRKRVVIEDAVATFRARFAEAGWRVFTAPAVRYAAEAEEEVRVREEVDTSDPRRVLVALANPAHGADLLRVGRYVATGADAGGDVLGLHLVQVPFQTPLSVARDRFARERPAIEETLGHLVGKARRDPRAGTAPLPLGDTEVRAVTDVAHDVFEGLVAETTAHDADLLLMGWRGGFTGRRSDTPVKRVIMDTPADLAVLRDRGVGQITTILVPWGGGAHAHLGLELAVRIARATGAAVHLQRIVRTDVDTAQARLALVKDVAEIVGDYNPVLYHVDRADGVVEGIEGRLAAETYDLVIIGASHEWSIRTAVFGTIPDVVADQAYCSVLMVRRFRPERWTTRAAERFRRIKESVGMTTSPEEAA